MATHPQRLRRRAIGAASVAAWLVATCLLAVAPLVYFVSGAADATSDADRARLAAIPMLIAWPVLALALARVRRGRRRGWALIGAALRALVLVLFAAGLMVLARRLGSGPAIAGDADWVVFWAACGGAWIAVTAAMSSI